MEVDSEMHESSTSVPENEAPTVQMDGEQLSSNEKVVASYLSCM